MNVKITSNDKDVLCSGSVITFGLGETRFDIHHNNEELGFIINFIDEEGDDAKRRNNFEIISDTLGKLTFYNYKSSSGIYTTKPAYLGTIGNRELYLQYRIDNLESNSKLLFYTFYLGTEVENGAN